MNSQRHKLAVKPVKMLARSRGGGSGYGERLALPVYTPCKGVERRMPKSARASIASAPDTPSEI